MWGIFCQFNNLYYLCSVGTVSKKDKPNVGLQKETLTSLAMVKVHTVPNT
jgi:hypothetical protein